jgi:hypothetical protein
MTPKQARLLLAILHRVNASEDPVTRELINELFAALGADADLVPGRGPVLTIVAGDK